MEQQATLHTNNNPTPKRSKRAKRQTLYARLAVGFFLLVGLASLWIWVVPPFSSSIEDVPILGPDEAEEPLKVRPKESDNPQIPHKDKLIYREFSPSAAVDQGEENLLALPEDPQALSQGAENPGPDGALNPQMSIPLQENQEILVPHGDAPQEPSNLPEALNVDKVSPINLEDTIPSKNQGITEPAAQETPSKTAIQGTTPSPFDVLEEEAHKAQTKEPTTPIQSATQAAPKQAPQPILKTTKSLREELQETEHKIMREADSMIEENMKTGKPLRPMPKKPTVKLDIQQESSATKNTPENKNEG